MLTITVEGDELYNEETEEFLKVFVTEITLEHSLVSMSKWESIHKKPFISDKNKTEEETLSYIKCMCLTPDVPPEVFSHLSQDNLKAINELMNDEMTATWFNGSHLKGKSTQQLTSELVYYYLAAFQIPFEVQHWHLNRMFTLLRVASEMQAAQDPKNKGGKVNKQEQMSAQHAENERRKALYGTSG